MTEHLPDDPATLKKYQRLLKPGGFLCLDARLTTLHWARNLDAPRDFICERDGPETWRTIRRYLWGRVGGFERDMIQAYRWVLQLPR